jgi:putative spermidine/putrescine transport system ATP-binding protein
VRARTDCLSVPQAEPAASSSGAEALVRFIKVSKSFDGVTLVVRDLDLDIMEGEFLTLLGPSGSGKTTTLMMLAGFEAATVGEIHLRGRPITRLPPYRRNIGVVFQNYALFPHMSVSDNIAFPLQVRKMSRAETAERVKRALAMVSLEGLGERLPAQLSGGQQQRVAVARALVFDPALVLMDEPLGALDKQLRDQMQYELKRLHERFGITVVYVTHDQSEALTMSDRIAVFDRGAVQQLAAPAALYEAPATSFVARFIGENNSPSGRILSRAGDACRVLLDAGPEVEAAAVRATTPGERTTLSIRPERVLVNPDEERVATRLPGRVRELIYVGDHLRVYVAAGAQEFIVKIPNSRYVPLRVGDDVTIGWHTADCRALDPVEINKGKEQP